MKKTVLVFLALALNICAFAQFSSSKKEAYDIAQKAITKMEEGSYSEAISLLEISIGLDPKNVRYTYEKGYAYYLMQDYDNVISSIEPVIEDKDAADLFYQLLGNSYDLEGNSAKANEIYNKGLLRFPKSGRLYFELGTNEYRSNNLKEAIATWEKGIAADPYFASNYYYLGKLFSNTKDKIWSLIYCELFLNLERNTNRTREISEILFNTYKNAISVSEDGEVLINFTDDKTVDPSQGFKLTYPAAYELNVSMSLPEEQPLNETGLSISFLNVLRENFIFNWYEHKQDKKYPTALFDFHKKMIEEDQFTAYNYWLFLKGNEDEFWDWFGQNKAKFKTFEAWFNENQISLESNNVVLNKK